MINGVSKLSRMNFEFPCSPVKVKPVDFESVPCLLHNLINRSHPRKLAQS